VRVHTLLALGVGYVVGARAGRGRYRQIVSAAGHVADSLERYARGSAQGSDERSPNDDVSGGQSSSSWRDAIGQWTDDLVASRGVADEADSDDVSGDSRAGADRSSVSSGEYEDLGEFERLTTIDTLSGPPGRD
jgi:hypothetical protein